MNAPLVVLQEDALFAVGRESQMLITAKSVLKWKKTEMDVLR
jgi:hypothetical protein